MVVSDHAPVPPLSTSGDFEKVCPGIPSVQLSLPSTWTEARARGYTLAQLAHWMCRNPAQLAGLSRKGAIDVGFDADLVVFKPHEDWTVNQQSLEAGLVTPYVGRRLYGIVERTYLRGVRVFERGRVFGPPRGRLLVTSM
jgi:allantoinase